jgi:hypothetical protein
MSNSRQHRMELLDRDHHLHMDGHSSQCSKSQGWFLVSKGSAPRPYRYRPDNARNHPNLGRTPELQCTEDSGSAEGVGPAADRASSRYTQHQRHSFVPFQSTDGDTCTRRRWGVVLEFTA